MNYNLVYKSNDLVMFSTIGLMDLSKKFILYYKDNIDIVRKQLGIYEKPFIKIVVTDDLNDIKFYYGKTDFCGYYTDYGAFAYLNIYGNKTEEYMFKGLMHEIVHHLYRFYLYGKDKERITWIDEGLAQLLSN